MEQLEREVRQMLKDRAGGLPNEYEASSDLLGRTSRRRTMKMVGIGAACAVVAIGVAGAIARSADTTKKGQTVVTAPKTRIAPAPTTVPAGDAHHPTIPTVACPLSQPHPSNGLPGGAPAVTARATTTDDAAIMRTLSSYAAAGDSNYVVAAPTGWSCKAVIGEDGSSGMDVFPGKAPAVGATGPIHIANDWLWHGSSGAGTACEVFNPPVLVNYFRDNYHHPEWCKVPAGRTVTGDDKFASFEDKNGASGVGVMRLPSNAQTQDGAVTVLTCTPIDGLTKDDCVTIVADFSARNQTLPTPPPPAVPTITLDGKIGPLQLGTSTAADVRAALGAPDATAHGNLNVGLPDFDTLGYDCPPGLSPAQTKVAPMLARCTSAYYINATTKTLAGFSTSAPAFATEKGTTVGMTLAEAERREGQAAPGGCFQNTIELGGFPSDNKTPFSIFISGGSDAAHQVIGISAESSANQVGVLFC